MTVYGFFEGGSKAKLQDASRLALEHLKDALSTDNAQDKDAYIRKACAYVQTSETIANAIKAITQ